MRMTRSILYAMRIISSRLFSYPALSDQVLNDGAGGMLAIGQGMSTEAS